MKLTNKHNDILTFIKQQPRTKKEIVEQFKSWYHKGLYASKYIPMQLKALVLHGFLEVENDIYKIKQQT